MMPVRGRILFLVDHKHRDLPSLSLIGFFLRRRGLEPSFVALGAEAPVVAALDPATIVLPKPAYDYECLLRWRAEGRRLIVLETEGNPQDQVFEMRILVPPDLYLFWNQTMADRHRRRLERHGTQIQVVGFHRSDLLHSRLDGVFPTRPELLTRYGLDPSRPTMTIATSAQDSHFSAARLRQKRKRRSRSFAKTADYGDIVANMCELRDRTVELVTRLADESPHINMIIKPHPHENVLFWSDFVANLGKPQVRLVVGEPINHLLRVSDLHVAFNVCTTTVEALLAGVPTVELQTERSRTLYGEAHLDLPNYRVLTYSDMAAAVAAEMREEPAARHQESAQQAKLTTYIDTFLHAFDGRRCEAYTNTIVAWIRDTPPPLCGSRVVLAKPRLAMLWGVLRAKALFRRLMPRREHDELIRQVNTPERENTRPTRQIQGVLVDQEFGLFDNRMRPGDELPWMERFERACGNTAAADS
jgi:surface carbohydrate biosynthesis protein